MLFSEPNLKQINCYHIVRLAIYFVGSLYLRPTWQVLILHNVGYFFFAISEELGGSLSIAYD